MKKNGKQINLIFFLVLFVLTIFLSFNYHHGRGYLNYRGEIFADKAGYYSYLPSLMFYRFDPDLFPYNIEEKTGYGFTLNTNQQKIFIKYTYGVSLLVSPFFFATHVLSMIFDIPDEGGFSPWYHKMVNVAAAVYLILGLMLLRRVLAQYFRPAIQYILILVVFFGTNLFYFTIVNTLMSHVYSFFLFSLFLFALTRFLQKQHFHWFLLLAFAGSLVALVRPTNAILWFLFLFWDVRSGKEIVNRIRIFIKPKHLLSFIAILFLVFLPQLIYWKWAWDSWFFYSYHDEGFTYWLQPRILKVWFAPLNGLFLYSPVVLFMVAGMIYMIIKRILNGWMLLILFLFISYLFSSWSCWYFGCSYGHRAFIEFYVLFLISLGYLIQTVFNTRRWIRKTVLLVVLALCVTYSVVSILSYPGCYRGSTWDFTSYKINLATAGLIPGEYIFHQEFTDPVEVTPSTEYTASVRMNLEEIIYRNPTIIKVETRISRFVDSSSQELDARIVCSVNRDDTMLLYQSASLDSIGVQHGDWIYAEASFEIPDWFPEDILIKVYCWNRSNSRFFLDEMKISYLVY